MNELECKQTDCRRIGDACVDCYKDQDERWILYKSPDVNKEVDLRMSVV